MAIPPVPRAIGVCEDITLDPLNSRRLTLHRVIHASRPKVGCGYPVVQDRLCVFAQLSECRGNGTVCVSVRRADTDELVYRSPTRPVAVPDNDPLTVRGLQFAIGGLRFPARGLYWVELWYDDGILTQTPVVFRPALSSSE